MTRGQGKSSWLGFARVVGISIASFLVAELLSRAAGQPVVPVSWIRHVPRLVACLVSLGFALAICLRDRRMSLVQLSVLCLVIGALFVAFFTVLAESWLAFDGA
jgi:hypothetical protein